MLSLVVSSDGHARIQCCGVELQEHFDSGSMRCRLCNKQYSLTSIREYLEQSLKSIQSMFSLIRDEQQRST